MADLPFTRRSLLGATAAASLFSSALSRALAVAPSHDSGTIMDVDHIVVFMLENRSFDHYFGTMRGIRGFADPHPVLLPGGNPVWQQPDGMGGIVSPFAVDTRRTNFPVLKSLDHHWGTGHDAWNEGRYDRWVQAKGGLTMGHLARADIPYHHALADAFTICDAYHCSLQGPTCPNRLYLMTGNVDHPNTGGHGPVIDNIDITQRPDGAIFGRDWRTYAEMLQDAGVSWQLYRQGDDNSDDNSDGGMDTLLAFERFRLARPGDPLYERGVRPRRLEQLKRDVETGQLAQVSWIVPPRLFCEHPNWPPAYGVEYLARIMDALTANPAVWSRTVFLMMYDENDGYFDHVVPPTPPFTRDQGLSTVSTEAERHPENGQPYGLGMRVPMLAISPWSKGGWVCSETFDHTSVLRFIETRFGVRAENVSAWRRAVCGDLTSAFDFSKPDRTRPARGTTIPVDRPLPDQATFNAYKAVVGKRPRPAVPHDAPLPMVEAGLRPSRALGYRLAVSARKEAGILHLDFINDGVIGGHFHVVDRLRPVPAPRRYTVEAGRHLSDGWALVDGRYALMVHGPAGHVWWFEGGDEEPLRLTTQPLQTGDLMLVLENRGAVPVIVEMSDRYADRPWSCTIKAGTVRKERVALAASHRWHDVTVRHGSWLRRLAGRVETGRPGLSDPAMSGPVAPGRTKAPRSQ